MQTVWEDTGIGDAFHPADGWPWSWPDSAMTDWVYAFDDGHVWAEGSRDGSHSIPTPSTARRDHHRHPYLGYCGTGRLPHMCP